MVSLTFRQRALRPMFRLVAFALCSACVTLWHGAAFTADDDYTEDVETKTKGAEFDPRRIVIHQPMPVNLPARADQPANVQAGNIVGRQGIVARVVVDAPRAMVEGGVVVGQPGVVIAQPIAVRQAVINGRIIKVQVSQFDQWVSGMNYPRRRSIESLIAEKVQEVITNYDLTDEEQNRVVLASRADKVRFDHDVEELRRRYEAALANSNDVLPIAKEAVTFQQRQMDLLGRESFFAKAVKRVIAGRTVNVHSSKHKIILSELLRHRHQADVEDAVRSVERFVELQAWQRQQLIEMLLRETRPPDAFGDYDDVVVKYRLSQIADDKWMPLFDETQWPKVQKAMESFRVFGPFLNRQGLVNEARTASMAPTNLDVPADATQPEQPMAVKPSSIRNHD